MRTIPSFAALLPALVLAAAAVLAACSESPAPTSPSEKEVSSPEKGVEVPAVAWRGSDRLVEVTVEPLDCPGCAKSIKEAVRAVEGVEDVTVNVDEQLVKITLAEGTPRDAAIDRLRKALHEDGRTVLGEPAPAKDAAPRGS
jgi:copper chaperone CopZ